MSDAPEEIPRGPIFPGLRNAPHRRLLLTLLALVSVAGIALVWPVYPLAGSIRPYVLGLPFSFAWVVGWLVIVFVALAVFYRIDESNSAD